MPPPLSAPTKRRAAIVKEARSLVGIHEVPAHSNSGTQVHMIQSATHAYGLPWCVSTRQYIDLKVLGSTWAEDTAGVYFYINYATSHGAVVPSPIAGCAVGYHIGQGHFGTVTEVLDQHRFKAVEGNEADAVRELIRDSRYIRCTWILRPELRG